HMELEEEGPSGYHWLDLMFSPLSNKDSVVRGHAVIIRDITKRKLAQTQLELTNNELADRIDELDEYGRDMKQINDMTVQLQACNLLAEAFPIVARHMQSLLPTLAGGLYTYVPEDQTMRLECSWNSFSLMIDEFNVGDCLGMVKGEVYRVGALDSEPSCRHVDKGYGHNYACHPLFVEGEPFALLHYYYLVINLSDNQVQMARIAADAIKMALVNLKMKDNFRQEAIRDPLTGLFNRRYMTENLQLALYQAERLGQPLSIIMVDVDHYKALNDTYGHGLGDQVLIQVGLVLRNNVRRGDIVCRYGGDEFLLIMPGIGEETAVHRAEMIHRKIHAAKVEVGGHREEVLSLSMGVASYPVHGTSVEAILRAADQALYRAKEGGRNRTVAAG
ncbi:MAG: GGDEF domain-containing protein, partial [Firmicutes bacterium]|nr:GGDEF domain-containing protein [Bacillota bacterium]